MLALQSNYLQSFANNWSWNNFISLIVSMNSFHFYLLYNWLFIKTLWELKDRSGRDNLDFDDITGHGNKSWSNTAENKITRWTKSKFRDYSVYFSKLKMFILFIQFWNLIIPPILIFLFWFLPEPCNSFCLKFAV